MNCFGKLPIKSAPSYCVVELLDRSELKLHIRDEDCGSVLLQKVWDRLNLFEREYFSLRFVNTCSKAWFWLDAQKNIQKQLKRHGIKETRPKFYFGVKFYAVDPCTLKEEISRYQFFQELRRDVAGGRLPLSFNLLAELGALVAQSELGDYDPRVHTTGYLYSLNLTADDLPDDLQTAITEIHRQKLRGVLPSQCELMYLDIIKKQDVYGVEFYNVKGSANAEYKIGPSPHGMVIYRGKHRAALYHWPRIDVINFKSKELIIQIKDKYGNDKTTHTFTCASTRMCKQLWKSCVEHHSFFRLTANRQESAEKGKFFQLGSKYRYSGRTETEIASVSQRIDQPMVNRPINRSLSMGKQASNSAYSNGWIGNMVDQRPAQGMFASANNSPGSVRSLKLKFQPKSLETEGSVRRHGPKSPRPHSTDGDSLRSKHNSRRSESRERRAEGTPKSQRPPADIIAKHDQQSSVNRIVRSYMPNSSSSFFDSGDLRRHSDRELPRKRREYENIVYNNQGLPVILATHKGEKADEKMPFYQQQWLQRTLQSRSRSKDHAAILDKARQTTHDSDFVNDPLMERILRPTTREEIRKTSLGFYEEKLMSRDSGTDSPTCTNYDDNNVNDLIKNLDKEHQRLTNGESKNTGAKWRDGWHGNYQHAASNHVTALQPPVSTITRVTMI